MTQHLYRHFADDGTLLYVGISLSAVARLGQHERHSNWFSRIRRVEIETFETRQDVLQAEREAVATENPECNINLRNSAAQERTAFMEAARKAREDLVNRTVNFKPLYTVPEAARELCMSAPALRKLIVCGEMGAFEMSRSTHRRKDGTKRERITYRISGWHIIDYLEDLEQRAVA